ncbi:hypothetical protein SAMN04488688_102749 [Paenibacillus sp. cl141a]|uniref:DUF1963 domain-containing protein n=1 Tax=Paenibacillus sp. cl141a TaxID=1761877 RepID=UPI0008CD067B|nr:DUF1963 domain-containing protein [Paenibacillus sp. cl141a]SEK96097.1 hypothetical protein SAMN04488688_102749 [Paenibacillus sp. cl141a]
MTERLPCRSEGCSATILPATAAKTDGYCMPCKQEMERAERQRYIEQHRRDIDLYEGITDPVEILKIMHTPVKRDPFIRYIPYHLKREEVYSALSAGDADRMLNAALELLESGDEDTCQEILVSLICYRNCSLESCIPILLKRGIYYPGILFKDASTHSRDELLQQVEQDKDNRNHLLLALAWIGDDQVVRQFQEWRSGPPSWAKELYVPPEAYAHEGGWELTENGSKRRLFYHDSYAIAKIVPSESAYEAEPEPAQFLKEDSASCPWCGSSLTTLADLDISHPRLRFLGLSGERLRVTTCVTCSCYDTIYMDVDFHGKSEWSQTNIKPEYVRGPDSEENERSFASAGQSLRLADNPRSSYYAAYWALGPAVSQIGGYPAWIQDAVYPSCPCCSRSMTFIGQLDWEQIEEYGEGIYYMFLCADCMFTATLFQQT